MLPRRATREWRSERARLGYLFWTDAASVRAHARTFSRCAGCSPAGSSGTSRVAQLGHVLRTSRRFVASSSTNRRALEPSSLWSTNPKAKARHVDARGRRRRKLREQRTLFSGCSATSRCARRRPDRRQDQVLHNVALVPAAGGRRHGRRCSVQLAADLKALAAKDERCVKEAVKLRAPQHRHDERAPIVRADCEDNPSRREVTEQSLQRGNPLPATKELGGVGRRACTPDCESFVEIEDHSCACTWRRVSGGGSFLWYAAALRCCGALRRGALCSCRRARQ